jgi:hypothetical protein
MAIPFSMPNGNVSNVNSAFPNATFEFVDAQGFQTGAAPAQIQNAVTNTSARNIEQFYQMIQQITQLFAAQNAFIMKAFSQYPH